MIRHSSFFTLLALCALAACINNQNDSKKSTAKKDISVLQDAATPVFSSDFEIWDTTYDKFLLSNYKKYKTIHFKNGKTFYTGPEIINSPDSPIFSITSSCVTGLKKYFIGNFETTDTVANQIPAFSHIVVVIGENTNANSVFGSRNAPYINSLAVVGAKFIKSFALFHPSQPNYLALFSGSDQGVINNDIITKKYTSVNLGIELIAEGKTYITYSEGLPSTGYDGIGNGLYVRKHNPSASWMGAGLNQIPANTNQPFSAFPDNFNDLPNVAFVIPDVCNDGHNDCAPLNNSTRQFDQWIQLHLDAYRKWAVNNNSLLIVTYDEDDLSRSNKIATIFYGANVLQGTYSKTINHYNILRTIEEANRLTTHAGLADKAAPINYCWISSPGINTSVFIPLSGLSNLN